MIYYQYFQHIFYHKPVGLNDKFWISKYEYFSSTTHTDMDFQNTLVQLLLWRRLEVKTKPALVEMAVLHCKTKGALVAAAIGANVRTFYFDNSYHESGNMNQYANSSYLCFYVSCVNVIVEEAFRTAKVRRSSHRKSASL